MCHKHESFALPNARDCEHGRQIGKCPECELADAKAEIANLRDTNRALNEAATQAVDACQRMTDKVHVLSDELDKKNELYPELLEKFKQFGCENMELHQKIARLTECVKAADEMLNSNPHAIFAWTIERYDAARKQVTI